MKQKRKQTDLSRFLNLLDRMKVAYSKAQVESTDKSNGETVYMTIVQNAFVFDRMTGKFLFTHFGGLLKPSETPQPKFSNQ